MSIPPTLRPRVPCLNHTGPPSTHHVLVSNTTRTRLASALLSPLCRSRTAVASLLRSEVPVWHELMESCMKASRTTAATAVDTTLAIVPAIQLGRRLEPHSRSTGMCLPTAPPTLIPCGSCSTLSLPSLFSETAICSGASDPAVASSEPSPTKDFNTPTLSEIS